MPQAYHHGVTVIEETSGARPITTVSTAIIGIVCTGEDADSDTFPLNKPVLLTNVQAAMGKAGRKGTLYKTLRAISLQTRPVTVVVRVQEGATLAETTSNIIGEVHPDGTKTGLKALEAAPAAVQVKPRILAVPDLDTQPVANALAATAQVLRAMVYVAARGEDGKLVETLADAIAYRKKFSQREVMVIWPDFVAWDDVASKEAVVPAVAYAVGLRAKIDQQIGWHKTISNVAVNGIEGISKPVSWDLQNPATDAGLLNENQVTTLINRNGFRFWGSRTASDEPRFSFENYTRTAQVLADTIAEAQMPDIDGVMQPMLPRDMLESIRASLRKMVGRELIGADAWYDEDDNDVTSLADGTLALIYDYTPTPPLENLKLRQRQTDRYLVDFAAQVNA
ncbi:phage tail sheath subtilisin-like domain-containing protein [Burkholderia vietnamiensis]|uniref:phage tail sheath subtilisin-like domain-containing protein n=1 Tax=Burkholderia vietnamiensis TaxID=60552 RepID=UPI001CF58B39|nr:phage tail sheath subtilisin-like domain-containing protein [Burkholderia vietnamiensis]MCA8182502.1 phage tail sheath subtilisin-like domain-containing protein [Burkholderia vietnamiensis]